MTKVQRQNRLVAARDWGQWEVGVMCKLSRSVVPTLCNPTDCSPPGSSVHGIFQARILK